MTGSVHGFIGKDVGPGAIAFQHTRYGPLFPVLLPRFPFLPPPFPSFPPSSPSSLPHVAQILGRHHHFRGRGAGARIRHQDGEDEENEGRGRRGSTHQGGKGSTGAMGLWREGGG